MNGDTDRPTDEQPVNDGAEAATPGPRSTKPASARSGSRKPAGRNPRRRARELAVQGLYQWLIGGGDPGEIDAHLRDQGGFEEADSAHYDALLHGCVSEAAALDEVLTRHVDRPTRLLSPVEHAVLMIGVYELTHCIDVPYRVVINEAVEVAKVFGGTDGHKYVNGVLDRAASDLRAVEVAARRRP